MNSVICKIHEDFESIATEEVRLSALRFFKESINVYGLRSAEVKSIAKKHFPSVKDISKSEFFEICESLWETNYMEDAMLVCNWSNRRIKEYEKSDFARFESWIEQYITNWATCDTFCNHTIGDMVVKYPEFIHTLKKWTVSDSRWVKRAAAVSLIVPAKKGMFLSDVFEIADTLLLDSDDMVQKGYAWMLKVASQAHQKEVFDYVMRRKAIMPRTALRYAIEKMPKDLRAEAMKKA